MDALDAPEARVRKGDDAVAHNYATPRTAKRDQDHINAAYRHARRIINELCRVRDKDSELARVLRGMYTVEDILSQYIGQIDAKEG